MWSICVSRLCGQTGESRCWCFDISYCQWKTVLHQGQHFVDRLLGSFVITFHIRGRTGYSLPTNFLLEPFSTSDLWLENSVENQSLYQLLPYDFCLHDEHQDNPCLSLVEVLLTQGRTSQTGGRWSVLMLFHVSLMLLLPWRSGHPEDSWCFLQTSAKCAIWNFKNGRILFSAFMFSFNQFLNNVYIFFHYVFKVAQLRAIIPISWSFPPEKVEGFYITYWVILPNFISV